MYLKLIKYYLLDFSGLKINEIIKNKEFVYDKNQKIIIINLQLIFTDWINPPYYEFTELLIKYYYKDKDKKYKHIEILEDIYNFDDYLDNKLEKNVYIKDMDMLYYQINNMNKLIKTKNRISIIIQGIYMLCATPLFTREKKYYSLIVHIGKLLELSFYNKFKNYSKNKLKIKF